MKAQATAALAAWRELQSRDVLLWLCGAAFVGFTLALLERRALAAFALDRALVGSTFGLLVPLCCFAVTRRLAPAQLDRTTAFFGRTLVLLGAQAAIGMGLALLTLAATGSAHWTRELVALSWIAPLGATAHGAAQLLGITFGRHGALLVLACDWVLGSFHGALAVPWPRAHVRNLLGGAPPLDVPQAGSALTLAALVVACVLVARWRVGQRAKGHHDL